MSENMEGYVKVQPKKPWLGALLGILIAGAGLMYAGKWGLGILFMIATVVFSIFTGFIAAPFMWLISCVWGYYAVKQYNERAGY